MPTDTALTPGASSVSPMAQEAVDILRPQLLQTIDRVHTTINNTVISLARNKALVKVSEEDRAHLEEWLRTITSQLKIFSDFIRNTRTLSLEDLQQASASVAVFVDVVNEALHNSFARASLRSPSSDEVTKLLTIAQTQAEQQLLAELQRAQQQAPTLKRSMIPSAPTPEMIQASTAQNLMVSLEHSQQQIAEQCRTFGLNRINRAARATEDAIVSLSNAATPYIPSLVITTLTAAAAVGALTLYKNNTMEGIKSSDAVKAVLGTAFGVMMTKMAEAGGLKALTFVQTSWSKAQNQAARAWRRIKGIPVKETIGALDILTPDDCEGVEEPIIGLESQFNRVMGSVESALVREKIGEAEPFKGIQKTFVFIGAAGGGKTFLAQQLKWRIAKLRDELGIPVAYQHIGAFGLAYGDLLAYIHEAQQRKVALILWVDELHLMKPHKDGNPSLLEQLLQTESVNKSNIPIWIFAATNEPGRFDSALIRSIVCTCRTNAQSFACNDQKSDRQCTSCGAHLNQRDAPKRVATARLSHNSRI